IKQSFSFFGAIWNSAASPFAHDDQRNGPGKRRIRHKIRVGFFLKRCFWHPKPKRNHALGKVSNALRQLYVAHQPAPSRNSTASPPFTNLVGRVSLSNGNGMIARAMAIKKTYVVM